MSNLITTIAKLLHCERSMSINFIAKAPKYIFHVQKHLPGLRRLCWQPKQDVGNLFC